MHPPLHKCFNSRHSGFSLMEMAIVLMIIGTLMTGVLVAVSQSTANARVTTARAQLREIEEALYGYAQAYGRLPCPATDTSNGLAETDTSDTVGDCTEFHGFIPIATLGLNGSINTDGLLLDPWANPIRYSVASATYMGNQAFTNTTGLNGLFNASALAPTDMLRVCDTSDCSGDIYADTAPAVILSMGANWATYTSANEETNAGDGTSQLGGYNVNATGDFVSTGYSEENFDDQLVWLSPYVLFNRLVTAGKLP